MLRNNNLLLGFLIFMCISAFSLTIIYAAVIKPNKYINLKIEKDKFHYITNISDITGFCILDSVDIVYDECSYICFWDGGTRPMKAIYPCQKENTNEH